MINKTLDYGIKDPQVKELQIWLNANGFTVAQSGPGSPGNETDYFGPATQKAVQKFQASSGIVSSGTPTTTGYGRVGPLTLSKIGEASKNLKRTKKHRENISRALKGKPTWVKGQNLTAQHKQNISKGNKGNNGYSILKEKDVLEIKRLRFEKKLTYKQLSKIFGVAHQTIASIIQSRSWKYLNGGCHE